MGILVIGMRFEFGDDVRMIAPLVEGILNQERERHTIYHWNSEVVDYHKDISLRYKEPRGELDLIEATEKEEFLYIMGVHFGRCLYFTGRHLRCPIGFVLNATLIHPQDNWEQILKDNKYPLYLWGGGFYKL